MLLRITFKCGRSFRFKRSCKKEICILKVYIREIYLLKNGCRVICMKGEKKFLGPLNINSYANKGGRCKEKSCRLPDITNINGYMISLIVFNWGGGRGRTEWNAITAQWKNTEVVQRFVSYLDFARCRCKDSKQHE